MVLLSNSYFARAAKEAPALQNSPFPSLPNCADSKDTWYSVTTRCWHLISSFNLYTTIGLHQISLNPSNCVEEVMNWKGDVRSSGNEYKLLSICEVHPGMLSSLSITEISYWCVASCLLWPCWQLASGNEGVGGLQQCLLDDKPVRN